MRAAAQRRAQLRRDSHATGVFKARRVRLSNKERGSSNGILFYDNTYGKVRDAFEFMVDVKLFIAFIKKNISVSNFRRLKSSETITRAVEYVLNTGYHKLVNYGIKYVLTLSDV